MPAARGGGSGDLLEARPEREPVGKRPVGRGLKRTGLPSWAAVVPTTTGEAVAPSALQFLPVDLHAPSAADLARPPEWPSVASPLLMNRLVSSSRLKS